MKKLIIFLLFPCFAFGITFPIDKDNCIMSGSRIVLTGWYYQQRTYGIHKAIDIPAAMGTSIRAVVSGVVIEKGFEYRSTTKQAYGNYIVIKAKDGTRWLYAHLHTTEVKMGEEVVEGQVIGFVGHTGMNYESNHLHLEKRDANNNKILFTKDFGEQFALRKYE